MTTPKSVLITGCSTGGIGHALASRFNAHGFHVFASTRHLANMSSLAANLSNMTLLELDVTSPSSIAAAAKVVEVETGGKLDVLVNNAGRLCVMPFLDTDLEEAKRVFDVNFWGAVRLVRAMGAFLIKAKGVIVNVSSIAGCVAVPFMGAYAASKAALTMASETLRLEMEPLGVRVLTVKSGLVNTRLAMNLPEFKLPSDSFYRSIEGTIAARAKMGELAQSGMELQIYAESIIRDVLARTSGSVWRGSFALFLRCLLASLPRYLVVSI
ncbi:MAG: hypothetical protein Q9178_006644 [Gyalolechia marmorata]